MTHKLKRDELRERVDKSLNALLERRKRETAQDAYVYRRRREMPRMIEAARRKLAMLEREARSYGLDPEVM